MRYNITTKFDLYGKLQKIVESTDNIQLQNICKQAIHDLKSNFTNTKAKSYLNDIRKYSWVMEAKKFLNLFDVFLNENKYSIELEAISEKLQLNESAMYIPLIKDIKSIICLEESEIIDKLHTFAKYSYEPNVKRLVEGYNREINKVQQKGNASISTFPVSPTFFVGESLVFSVAGKNYITNNTFNSLDRYNGKETANFTMSKKALDLFKYTGNDTFLARLPKGDIKVVTSTGSVKMFINEKEVANKFALDAIIKTNTILPVLDKNLISIVTFMYENANQIVEINFAKQVNTVNENFTVFKLANNQILVDKVNPATRKYDLIQYDYNSIVSLKEDLNSKYKLDFDCILEGLDINSKTLEFKQLVEEIDLKQLLDSTKVSAVADKINKAHHIYESLNKNDRKSAESHFNTLCEKTNIINSNEVKYIVETRETLFNTLKNDNELLKVSKLLNEKLKELI